MSVRALIAALMLTLSSRVEAESLAARKPWHAVVTSPRAGLPAVTIDLGYPGPYVPVLNSPITIRATAADVPFDGYIGYHFSVSDRLTLDTPVIARAILRPHQSWSFTTTATMRKCCIQNIRIPREIAVEWRDRTMHVIASRSAGVPPWTSWDQDRLPLAVGGVNTPEVLVLGAKPYVERAEALADYAQWYAGFSAVVIPVATWLDLPERIREAIFGSGMYVVFFGFPRPDQHLGRLDQTLLPVAFSAGPSSYDAPWPYHGSRRMPVAAPLSWIAKEGSDKIGSDQNPYIARTNAASWGPDEVAVIRPLPEMARFTNRRGMSFGSLELETGDWPQETRRFFLSMVAKRHFLSVYTGATATTVAIVLAIGVWLLLRKTPRTFIAVSVVLAAAALFAQRGRIRPPSEVRDFNIRAPIAPGIIDHVRVWRVYGPAPLAGTLHASAARTSITGDYGNREDAEVRTSDTPSSMGLLIHNSDWDAVGRWSYQREVDTTSTSPGNGEIARPTIMELAQDYHSPPWFSVFDRPGSNSRASRMVAQLKTRSDGRSTCAFALPTDTQRERTVVLTTASFYAGSDVEIAWRTGSVKLKLVKKDAYWDPAAQIPRDVIREIAAQGGIAYVTIDRPLERPTDRVSIEIRE